MFTGVYPHANGQYGLLNAGVGFRLHENLVSQTLPALLKQAGYETGILGKLHVGPENQFPFDTRVRVDTRDVRATADRAGEFFQKASAPFFFMANYSDPHVAGRSPRPPKEAFPTQYKGIPEEPLTEKEVAPFPFQRLEDPEQKARVTQYYNAVTRVDYGIGLLLQKLERSGKAENTVVIVVGDHGPPFVRGKTTCYEAGVKIPLIIRWPEQFPAGSRSASLVSTVDLLPTFLSAAGLSIPPHVQGQTLMSSLQQETRRKYLATEFHFHGSSPFFPRRTLRNEHYKLIHNIDAGKKSFRNSVDGDAACKLAMENPSLSPEIQEAFERVVNPPEFELYDLKADPWEFHNLADDPAHQKIREELTRELLHWRKQTADPLLTAEGYRMMKQYEQATPAN